MSAAESEIKAIWDALRKIKDKLEAMFFPSMDDFNLLKNRIEKLENQCNSLKKAFGDLDN